MRLFMNFLHGVACLTLFAVLPSSHLMARVNKRRKMEIIVMCCGEIYNETVCATELLHFWPVR
jgi:hypothetical protein